MRGCGASAHWPATGRRRRASGIPSPSGTSDHLGPPAFLLKASLDEVGGPDVLAMDGGKLEVGQAGLEVLLERSHRRWMGITEPGQDLFGQAAAGLEVGSVADGLQISRTAQRRTPVLQGVPS